MPISKSQLNALNLGLLDNIGKPDSPDLAEGTLLEQAMFNIAEQIVKDLKKSVTDKGLLATKTLRQSIEPQPAIISADKVEVTIVMDKQWRWANEGRRKGKMPPIQSIEEWITAKGIQVRQSRGESKQSVLARRRTFAYLIARKIGQRGTIKRFQYKGSKFIEAVLTPNNIKKIAEHLAEMAGKKIELYFKFN